MAKSFKQQKTRESFSKDVLKQMSKKHRRLNKELANTYIDEEVDELEGEEKYGHEDSI
jgi:predicted CopG family antitoxin